MSLTYSSMLELNSNLIKFDLPNSVTNKNFSTDNLDLDKPSLIMFICNHCPYVIHYHEEIQNLTKDFEEKFNFVAISSNDVENYPQDSPEKMKILWQELDLKFPYLYDETQEIAKKYKAECTPEFYVFNAKKKLVYRGRFDSTSPGSDTEPNGEDLRSAMQASIDGQKISDEQFPSMGCNIKWK